MRKTLAHYHAIREQLRLLAHGNMRARIALRIAEDKAKRGDMQGAYKTMRTVRDNLRWEAIKK